MRAPPSPSISARRASPRPARTARVVPWNEANLGRRRSAVSNGLPAAALTPPGGGPYIVDDAVNPPRNELTSPDLNLDGALCWRALPRAGGSLPDPAAASDVAQQALRQGIAEVRAGGDLHGKPALILHGRKDALIAPNHSSRAYFGLNQHGRGPPQPGALHRGRATATISTPSSRSTRCSAWRAKRSSPCTATSTRRSRRCWIISRPARRCRQARSSPRREETCGIPVEPASADRIRFFGRVLVIPAGGTPGRLRAVTSGWRRGHAARGQKRSTGALR